VPKPAARATLDAAQIEGWLRARLAAYKLPRIVEFVAELPKTGTGKLLWRELQARQDEADRARRRTSPSAGLTAT